MGYHYQPKTSSTPKRLSRAVSRDEQQYPAAHDHHILNLQRTIGNQAVQRLLQRDPADEVVPVDSRQKENATPSAVGAIVGRRHGKFESKSRLPGHEGEVEMSSLAITPSKHTISVQFTKTTDETSAHFQRALVEGEPITSAKFMLIKRNDRGEIETVKTFEFKDGLVSSMQMSTSEGVAYEAITIEFKVDPEKE